MTNVGEVTKKVGSRLVSAGLFIAGIGLFLIVITVTQGNFGAPLTWTMVAGGLVLAAIGYARRILAAVESR